MEPWYKVTTPCIEVREGRSFNPDEFAIGLEQVVIGQAPQDYRHPKRFFDRTVSPAPSTNTSAFAPSAKVKRSKSGAWLQKIHAPPICSC